MRLVVLVLALLAFGQPALARERGTHHRHHHHFAKAPRVTGLAQYWHWQQQPYASYAYGSERRMVLSRRARAAADYGWGWSQPAWQPSYAATQYAPAISAAQPAATQYDSMIARHAAANGVPEALVRRVIMRESRYNPRIVGAGGAIGMMQIKLATARSMGYSGSAAGLLDPETNLTYAVRYLAGAYRVAGGNADAAVGHYARGYYYAAKRQGLTTASATQSGWSNAYQPTAYQSYAWAQPAYNQRLVTAGWTGDTGYADNTGGMPRKPRKRRG